MNYLLDTHTLIWSILDKEKISLDVKQILETTENKILVSSISLWEIAIKYSLNRLELTGIKPDDLINLSLEIGFEHIPLSPIDCSTYYQLGSTFHKDPFDRMLIWQALQNNYTLITKDSTIHQYKSIGLKTFW